MEIQMFSLNYFSIVVQILALNLNWNVFLWTICLDSWYTFYMRRFLVVRVNFLQMLVKLTPGAHTALIGNIVFHLIIENLLR